MARAKAKRVLSLAVLAALVPLSWAKTYFTMPHVHIEVSSPKGFAATMPDIPGMTLFMFQGNVDKEVRDIDDRYSASLVGLVRQGAGRRWIFQDPDAELQVGDVVNYYVSVVVDGVGYVQENLSFVVKGKLLVELKPILTTELMTILTEFVCQPSITTVRGSKTCAGQVIFEDQFEYLRTDLWQVEQYIPIDHPEYPFVSYQSLNDVVSVSEGYLRITPKLQEDLPEFYNGTLFNGDLDLFRGCTSSAEACYRQGSEPDILPPVVSGRVTSSNFAFTYGTVYVRAKLPKGDWIYPEILLEPFLKKYGRANFASGVIKIAAARGNKELRGGTVNDYGNKVLYGGPVLDFQCRQELLAVKVLEDGRLWGDDFHEYSVNWTPDHITLSVDGREWARVDGLPSLGERLPSSCTHLNSLLRRGTNLAPFDDHFYLTLGVAVGGISEFADNAKSSGGKVKPWRNSERKAMQNFWKDLNSWQSTWTQPELLVDYVKVVAL